MSRFEPNRILFCALLFFKCIATVIGQEDEIPGQIDQDGDITDITDNGDEDAPLPVISLVPTTPESPEAAAEAKLANYTQVSFRMSARKLPRENIDPWGGSPDPYVIVSRSTQLNNYTDWVHVLTTKTQVDNPDPNWIEVLTIRLIPGQKWKFDVNDFDPIGADDYIGQVVIPAEDLINLAVDSMSRAISPKGSGIFIIYKFEE